MVESGQLAGLRHTQYRFDDGDAWRARIFIDPSVGYFVGDNLLVRLNLWFSHDDIQEGSSIGAGAGLAGVIRLDRRYSLLPAADALWIRHDDGPGGKLSQLRLSVSGHCLFTPSGTSSWAWVPTSRPAYSPA